jgi:hypothetical protein
MARAVPAKTFGGAIAGQVRPASKAETPVGTPISAGIITANVSKVAAIPSPSALHTTPEKIGVVTRKYDLPQHQQQQQQQQQQQATIAASAVTPSGVSPAQVVRSPGLVRPVAAEALRPGAVPVLSAVPAALNGAALGVSVQPLANAVKLNDAQDDHRLTATSQTALAVAATQSSLATQLAVAAPRALAGMVAAAAPSTFNILSATLPSVALVGVHGKNGHGAQSQAAVVAHAGVSSRHQATLVTADAVKATAANGGSSASSMVEKRSSNLEQGGHMYDGFLSKFVN